MKHIPAFALLLSVAVVPALAQQPAQQQPDRTSPVAGQDPARAARNEGVGPPDFARAAAAELVGRTVNSAAGDRLGEVYDALVDGRSGQVQSLIVQTGSKDDPGRLVELPFEQVQLHASESTVVSKVSAASLKQLPVWRYEQLNNEVVAVRQR